MSLFARQHTAGQSDIEKALGKKIQEATKEEILSLFPVSAIWDSWGETDSNLRLTVHPDPWKRKKAWWQRLNYLWVFPLYAVVVGPILWVVTGDFGVQPNSKFGKFLMKLVGE